MVARYRLRPTLVGTLWLAPSLVGNASPFQGSLSTGRLGVARQAGSSTLSRSDTLCAKSAGPVLADKPRSGVLTSDRRERADKPALAGVRTRRRSRSVLRV